MLGPLLFIIYINDIAQSTSHFNCITFADDTTLCGAQTSHNDAKTTELELNKVTEWLKINKLPLNLKKTKAMVFHMTQKKVILPILRINGTIGEFADNFVFLGMKINKHLNWNHHNTDVANKIVNNGWYTKYIENIFAHKHITYNLQLTTTATSTLWYPIMVTPTS